MNKSIKRVFAMALAITTFSVLEPVKYSNILNTKAYADSDIYLKGISVTDGDTITLNSSKKTYITNVPNTDTEVVIRVTTNKKTDKVTIDGDKDPEKQSDTKYKKTVSLTKGVNAFEIVVEDEDGEKEREYTLKIDRGGKQSTDSESVFLDNINIDYGELDFLKATTSYDLNVGEDVAELRVQAKPENDNYIVRIDGIKVDDDEKFRRTIKLVKGQNQISIDVEDDEDDDNTKTYTLKVYRGKDPLKTSYTTTTNVKLDNDQDPIYLDDITLDDGEVKFTPNFNKKISFYSADVKESSEDIIVKAETEEDASIVKINGTTADSKNRKRVSLTKGKNVIEIQINKDCDTDDEDYEKRIYTLTVYRGTSEGTSTTSATNTNNENSTSLNTNLSTVKVNEWININGKWQYNDSTGNILKNTWYSDKNYGKTYYLQADGTMATGWLYNNGSWYYLDLSGAMQTGWKQIGPAWYYLYASGNMAINTTVDGYKLGVDGTWIR